MRYKLDVVSSRSCVASVGGPRAPHGMPDTPARESKQPSLAQLFAGNLNALRTARGSSMKQAASELGVAKSTWSQWESGAHFTEGFFVEILAQYFGVPPCRLLADRSDRCFPVSPQVGPLQKLREMGRCSHTGALAAGTVMRSAARSPDPCRTAGGSRCVNSCGLEPAPRGVNFLKRKN